MISGTEVFLRNVFLSSISLKNKLKSEKIAETPTNKYITCPTSKYLMTNVDMDIH